MNRFRLAICIVALLQPILVGCNCCGDKFSWMCKPLCCPERRDCCPTSAAPLMSGSGYATSIPIGTPAFGSGYSAPAMFGSGHSAPGMFDAPSAGPGCSNCVAGQPTSGGIGNGHGHSFPISTTAPNNPGFPYNQGIPYNAGPPASMPVIQGNAGPGFPGPINTMPEGTLPAPLSNEPPQPGQIPTLSPVPRLQPSPMPIQPAPAQPTPADPVSRSNIKR